MHRIWPLDSPVRETTVTLDSVYSLAWYPRSKSSLMIGGTGKCSMYNSDERSIVATYDAKQESSSVIKVCDDMCRNNAIDYGVS